MEFAHCPPYRVDLNGSEEEREEKIRKCLKKIHWVRPGAPRVTAGGEDRVEAIVILRRPGPLLSRPHEKGFLERMRSYVENFFRTRQSESDDSLLGFAKAYEWSIFKIPRMELLQSRDAVMQAMVLQREGYDVQVLLQRVMKTKPQNLESDLHRVSISDSRLGVVSKSFKDFYRA